MVNTIWKETFLIMCSHLKGNARYSGRFPPVLRITEDYTLQTLCGSPHKVCNEEAKLIGMPLNRALRQEDSGEIMDIIAGPCFLCDCSGENFGSLSREQAVRYANQFRFPEQFFRVNEEIVAIPYAPPAQRSHKDKDRQER